MRLRLARQRPSYSSGSTSEQQEFLAISAGSSFVQALPSSELVRKGRGEDPFYRNRRSFCNGPGLVVQFVRFINAHSHILHSMDFEDHAAFNVSTEGIAADFTKFSTFSELRPRPRSLNWLTDPVPPL